MSETKFQPTLHHSGNESLHQVEPTVLAETEPTENLETVFERQQAKRHLIAMLAVRLERIAESLTTKYFGSLEDVLTPLERSRLRPTELVRLGQYFDGFVANLTERQTQEKTLLARMTGDIGQKKQREEHLGKILYDSIFAQNRTGKKIEPLDGKVYGLRRKHYFVLLFEKRADYIKASEWKDQSMGEHSSDVKINYPEHPHSKAIRYLNAPVVLLDHAFRSGTAADELRLDETIRHEEAHAITSRVFDYFAKTGITYYVTQKNQK